MTNPWESRIDDSREVDSLYTFLIFCEDEVSECEYFKYFETDKIKINIFQNQKNTIENVLRAISYCENNNIIDSENNVVDGFEVWCVYDIDKFIDDPNFELNKTKFNIANQTAESHKINLAWSNDSFELWIILHITELEDVNNFKDRNSCYDFLDNYFKNIENKPERLERILSHGTFSYKKDLKKGKNFIEIVRNGIIPNTITAITKSKLLEEIHHGKVDLTEWCPCTLVHYLVERLLLIGEKKIEGIRANFQNFPT